ncbi:TPA: hypothetical protein RI785_003611 [Vibrio cholerae]|uniref:Uncharacterized protein n=1 Tax=Vibrio cholerae TaxID=666 RepID=A0A5Q6PEL6_VIBCL|nr:hypothetical protein [Vibrio cholerae]KAA1253317.1 hypothetical protein F0M16_18255 [Vibrio cholerae]HDV5594842.1 hypothetical protein [Vibrio cholerae]
MIILNFNPVWLIMSILSGAMTLNFALDVLHHGSSLDSHEGAMKEYHEIFYKKSKSRALASFIAFAIFVILYMA